MKFVLRRTSRNEQPLDHRAFDLLCLTIASVFVLHIGHLPVWLSVVLALLLGWRWWKRREQPGRAPVYLKLPLLGLLAIAIITSYGSLFGREAGAALAVGLLVLKLLESETPRDARVGIAFACFALMTALLFDQGMVLTFLVALGLLPALAALRALEPARVPLSFKRELLPVLTMLGLSLPLALFAFVAVPRLSSPLWGAPPSSQARTGLSDRMSPGDFADLLTDDRPAMRVSFDGTPPPNNARYFRAYVMWRYDGRSWAYNDYPREPAPLIAERTIKYQISLEPSGQTVLPAMDVPVEAPPQGQLGGDREVVTSRPINDQLTYSMESALGYRLQPVLDDRSRRRALQLPDGFNPKTIALAQSWRQRHGDDTNAIVREALTLFHNGVFRYTLAPSPLGRDAMDDFLFSTHEGFCEHYASAFTILMRAAGIPARVITGYQGGYWNNLGNYLLVRQSDAHAWGEVWIAERGWVRVDPTAAVRPDRVSLGAAAVAGDQGNWFGNEWLRDARNHWDVVNRWWNQGVIGFSALRQRGLLSPLGIRETDAEKLGLLLAIGCVLFAMIGLVWALWRQRETDPLRAAMARLEHKLAGVAVVRRHSEGPQHYLSRAARALPHQRDRLEQLMRSYLDLRYAHDEPPPESLRAFRRAVRDFRPRRVVK
jgi:transglutaminase-like putative cysteine protease